MKNILAVILCMWLALASFAAVAEPSAPEHAAPAQPAVNTLEAGLAAQKQTLDTFKERLEFQDKRIGDLGLYLAFFGGLVTIVGGLITFVVIIFSFRFKSEAVSEAKLEARKEIESQAKRIIEDWLNNDGRNELVGKIDGILNELEAERQKAHEHNQQHEKLNQEQEKAIGILLSRSMDKEAPLSAEEKEQVEAFATGLQNKPPSQYQYADWHMLALQAYEAGKYEMAAEYLDKAAATAEKPFDRANALFNKGIVLGEAGKTKEALAAYERIITDYGDAPEAVLREQVAKALVNKGNTLGRTGQTEEALAAYERVITDYGDAPEAVLREAVAYALNGAGFLLLCEAKKHWGEAGEALLGGALEKIEQSLARKGDNAMAFGNKGYILFLQGKKEDARPILAEAMRLGGDTLRQAELKDADIHPLPQDEEFKALINSL